MIEKIIISALKSIDILEMECSKLNIIVGKNSSGKSTLLQAILLFSQNINDSQGLNGELISLGDFRIDVKNFNISSETVSIEIIDETAKNTPIGIIFSQDDSQSLDMQIFDNNIPNFIELSKNYAYGIHYLSCDRIGSQDIYMKNYSSYDGVGKNGEFALYHLLRHKTDILEKELVMDVDSETLQTQVNYWLNYIVSSQIYVEDVIGTDVLKGSYSIVEGKNLRSKHVGSGISYVISIIIMCLASHKGDILLIENPEIHLHPKAQSRVCEFLHFIALSGRQLFIETHSDHIFNGIRSGVATEKMKEEDVSINYFELGDNNCTLKTKIVFGKRGRIINFVEGLFDQFDIDLNKMLDI